MNISTRLFSGLFVAALSLNSLPAFADADHVCRLHGSYGYLYNGTSYTPAGPVPLTETGVFTVDKSGSLSGKGTLAFYFSNFGGNGPLWLLLQEVQSSGAGAVTPDTDNPCTGNVNFTATATVITSNPAWSGDPTFFKDKPRSFVYTITGPNHETVEIISTSPGTIASGTAHKLDFGY